MAETTSDETASTSSLKGRSFKVMANCKLYATVEFDIAASDQNKAVSIAEETLDGFLFVATAETDQGTRLPLDLDPMNIETQVITIAEL